MGNFCPRVSVYGASLAHSQGKNGEKVNKNAKALKTKESFFYARCCAWCYSVMVL
jgi:hypothetical protein